MLMTHFEEIMNSTTIILLLDAEHLTAANSRKRILLEKKLHFERLNDAESAAKLFWDELVFSQSFLTSPLHRHTKSPTLWSHRRWTVKELRRTIDETMRPTIFGQSISKCKALDESWALAELEQVVMKAAERHPRNYYSWSYARWLVDSEFDCRASSLAAQSWLVSAEKNVHSWCLKHHSDISGWSFLLYLFSKVPDAQVHKEILRITTDIATDFKWENESMRAFFNAAAMIHAEAASSFVKTWQEK
jgi:hypothetical protein